MSSNLATPTTGGGGAICHPFFNVMSYPFVADFFQAWRAGCKTVFGSTGFALMSSFAALGALMGDAGFSLLQAMLFSLFGFALPGQLIAAELHAHGAGIVAIGIAVFLVNARLFPPDDHAIAIASRR